MYITRLQHFERGIVIRHGECLGIRNPGWAISLRPGDKLQRVTVGQVSFRHPDLDLVLAATDSDELVRVDLKDHERGLVWVDERFHGIVGPGLHAFWAVGREVRIERVDAREVRFTHPDLEVILSQAQGLVSIHDVARYHRGLLYIDGQLRDTLAPGRHVFWTGEASVSVIQVDMRETILDIPGQDIMTADKVTLRMNAQATYRVRDLAKAAETVGDFAQALYRDAQLVLRAAIGARDLDELLTAKDEVTSELETGLRERAASYGIEILALGIRDLILPGDMKQLLNQVTEARKASEAALITRREETASMRSQANTAKIMADNPTLMRLRELEVLEKVAETANLTVVLGEQGLSDRVSHLL